MIQYRPFWLSVSTVALNIPAVFRYYQAFIFNKMEGFRANKCSKLRML